MKSCIFRRAFKHLIILFSIPLPVYPQAWTPARGELDLAFSYQNSYVAKHTLPHGERYDDGQIYTHGLFMDVSYGITNRLALKVSLPYITSRYEGLDPHPSLAPFESKSAALEFCALNRCLDEGTYHGTFQDFRAELRYKLRDGPVVITPFFTAIVPSHGYRFFAHSAVGRDQREFRLGLNLGRRLDPVLRNAFVQAQFSYNFVERVLDTPHNGSNAEFQVGYFLTRRLALIGLGTWQHTYGGVDYPLDLSGITNDQWTHHDQIARERRWDVGGGAGFQVNPKLAIFGAVVTTIWSTNHHALASGITVGMNWTFHTRGEGARLTGDQALGGAGGLAQTRRLYARK